MATRHKWRKGRGWMVCENCGCRYRTGMVNREYEQPNGTRSAKAGECLGHLHMKPEHAAIYHGDIDGDSDY